MSTANPVEFFRRTFLTDGLSNLLVNGVRRLRGEGGDPVVELQTNFGGGKTHSMIALYHLAGGTPAKELLGVDELLKEAGRRRAAAGEPRRARRPDDRAGHRPPQRTTAPRSTRSGASLPGSSAARRATRSSPTPTGRGTNPGAALESSSSAAYAPCLILIDEWVAYARQLYGVDGLCRPARSTRSSPSRRRSPTRHARFPTRCSSCRSRRRTSRSAARAARPRSSG